MRQNKIRLLEHPFWGVTIVHWHRVLIKKLSLFPFWALFIFIYKAQSWTTLVSCPTRRAGCSSCTAPWTRTSTSCSTQPSSSTSSSNTANPTNYRWVVSISVSHFSKFVSLSLLLFPLNKHTLILSSIQSVTTPLAPSLLNCNIKCIYYTMSLIHQPK